jgi:hypothetical protein
MEKYLERNEVKNDQTNSLTSKNKTRLIKKSSYFNISESDDRTNNIFSHSSNDFNIKSNTINKQNQTEGIHQKKILNLLKLFLFKLLL